MPRGSNVQKGQRNGGRQKGTPNKRTTERLEQERIALQAQREVDRARQANTKLGKDVLEEFMKLFAGMAAASQPIPVGVASPPGHRADEKKFLIYAKLTVDTATALAAFQSPKFKAIQVFAPPPTPLPAPTPAGPDGSNVITIDDPVALARVYQRMVKQVR